ncbi:MAG: ferredoxin--NADP(+) reductase [Rhodospirillaceae bacterium]|nr:ferredoxin--NADP(+) reductase [Rhodospirillaceae bacterium]
MARSPNTIPDDPSLRDLLLTIEGRRARARRRLSAAGFAAETREAPQARPQRAVTKIAPSGPGTMLDIHHVARNLVRFSVARPEGFGFIAGQSVRVEIDGLERRYTIVSAPHEPHLEFFVELVPGGRMFERLRALRPGGRVRIASAAKGGFRLKEGARRHLMLATVTGVNPYVAMLRDAVHRGVRDLGCIIVHGASHADEFGYRSELETLAAERPDLLVYIPTVSRPEAPENAGWDGSTGRADALIDPVRAAYGLTPADTVAYACGNPGMVDNARQHLGALGFEVRTESYG